MAKIDYSDIARVVEEETDTTLSKRIADRLELLGVSVERFSDFCTLHKGALGTVDAAIVRMYLGND